MKRIFLKLVPGAGLEPAQSCDREILSLLCLPIPPPGLRVSATTVLKGIMEARAEIEPTMTELQPAKISIINIYLVSIFGICLSNLGVLYQQVKE